MKFFPGEVVYWHRQSGNNHYVEYGIVDEEFSDAVCVDLLDMYEQRHVKFEGMDYFINDLESPTRWFKLPKGWSYSTKLFSLERIPTKPEIGYPDLANPEEILRLYKEGYLVKSDTIFHGIVNTQISKEGWRLVKEYDYSPFYHRPTHTSLRKDKCYKTYEEAEADLKAYEAELKRQSELSDYDWSVELIDKDLNRWAKIYSVPEDTKLKYRDWILSMKNVEDIETRVFNKEIQWKYWKNKRWNGITL